MNRKRKYTTWLLCGACLLSCLAGCGSEHRDSPSIDSNWTPTEILQVMEAQEEPSAEAPAVVETPAPEESTPAPTPAPEPLHEADTEAAAPQPAAPEPAGTDSPAEDSEPEAPEVPDETLAAIRQRVYGAEDRTTTGVPTDILDCFVDYIGENLWLWEACAGADWTWHMEDSTQSAIILVCVGPVQEDGTRESQSTIYDDGAVKGTASGWDWA